MSACETCGKTIPAGATSCWGCLYREPPEEVIVIPEAPPSGRRRF